MAKDARIPMRVPEALKAEFEWAAERDGARGVSTWLRQLGEERAEHLRDSTDERAASQAGTPVRQQEGPRSPTAGNGGSVEQPPGLGARSPAAASVNGSSGAGPAPLEFVPGFGLNEED